MLVYMAVYRFNGKGYIGSTVGDLTKRISLHYRQMRNDVKQGKPLSPFKQLLKDADWRNVEWRVLEHVQDKLELCQREAYWTEYYKTNHPDHGYNKRTGKGAMLRENRPREGWHIPGAQAVNPRLAAFFIQ